MSIAAAFYDRSAHDGDGDEMPVQFAFKHWGDEMVHFLLVGNRPAAAFNEDDGEADAA